MISCHVDWENRQTWNWNINIPHEINNLFLFAVDRYTKNNDIVWKHLNIWLSDFWKVEFVPEEIDNLVESYEILIENFDKINGIIPIPDKVWMFDWYIDVWYITSPDFDNFVELWTWWCKYFNKKEFILLISLIKKMAIEAKEKNKNLVFIWD